jgi:hypothetical protein
MCCVSGVDGCFLSPHPILKTRKKKKKKKKKKQTYTKDAAESDGGKDGDPGHLWCWCFAC